MFKSYNASIKAKINRGEKYEQHILAAEIYYGEVSKIGSSSQVKMMTDEDALQCRGGPGLCRGRSSSWTWKIPSQRTNSMCILGTQPKYLDKIKFLWQIMKKENLSIYILFHQS